MSVDVSVLPLEILQKIFSYLNWNALRLCGTVCKAWEAAAKETIELKWKNLCKRDFGQVYEQAHRKSQLSWEDLHKSLRLWPHINSSKIYLHYSDLLDGEDGYVPIDNREVKKIQVLKNGIIGFPRYESHKQDDRYLGRYGYCNIISYYDPETLKEIDQTRFDFEFSLYEENDDLIVLRGSWKKKETLHIITKVNKQIHRVGEMVQYEWGDISKFYLVKTKVFFMTKDYKIWLSKLVFVNGEPTIQSAPFTDFNLFIEFNTIEAFACLNDNQVNLLTSRGNIYSVEDQQLKMLCRVKKEMDNRHEVINMLKHHGFDWSCPEVYSWISNRDMLSGDSVSITHLKNATVFSYDRTVFIGTSRRSLHVYYNPYHNGQLSLYNRRPTLKIDLNLHVPYFDREDGYAGMVSSQRRILQIDVMEIQNGHRLILLYCQRLVAIEFHNDPSRRPGEPIDNVATKPRYSSYVRIA